MGYIGKHWRGDLTIQQAFWINFVALRAAFLLGDRVFQPPITMDVRPVLGLVLGYYAVNLLVVFPWQIRGLLRATDRMVHSAGSMTLSHLKKKGTVYLFLTNHCVPPAIRARWVVYGGAVSILANGTQGHGLYRETLAR